MKRKWLKMHDLNKVTKKVQEVFEDVPVFAVGGCVRDYLLKRKPKDFDYCINLDPDEIETAIKKAGRRAYCTGKKFGTIGCKINIGDTWHFVEVTTWRKEQYLPGSRKPQVEFVNDLKVDLSRRDYTLNAIAMDANGSLFDPFGGRLDIMAKKIKAVGVAKDRLKEDPLRMLRAARFAAQLGFEVDPNLIGVMRQMAPSILTVSRERWVQEMDKLLVSNNVGSGIDVLVNTSLLRYMIPELWLIATEYKYIFEEMIIDIQHQDDLDLKWAYLLEPIGKPYAETKVVGLDRIIHKNSNLISHEMAIGITRRLKFSNERTKKT